MSDVELGGGVFLLNFLFQAKKQSMKFNFE
jgi:hypothetical protein